MHLHFAYVFAYEPITIHGGYQSRPTTHEKFLKMKECVFFYRTIPLKCIFWLEYRVLIILILLLMMAQLGIKKDGSYHIAMELCHQSLSTAVRIHQSDLLPDMIAAAKM